LVWNGREAVSDMFEPPVQLLRRRNAEIAIAAAPGGRDGGPRRPRRGLAIHRDGGRESGCVGGSGHGPGRGVWIARQLVYLLQIAPAEPGTKVRLQTRPT
jgi:hypothetical protein